MSNFPRRSPRLSQPQNQQQQFQSTHSSPAGSLPSLSGLSQISSDTTTSHPSPLNNFASFQQPNRPVQLQLQSQLLAPAAHLTAPLPSPSGGSSEPFFSRPQIQHRPFMGGSDSQSNMPQGQNNGYGGQPAQTQPQQNQHHNSFSQSHRPKIHHSTSEQLPPGLPPDFLAEAAKRAQMACLMRDLGDVSL